MLVSTYFGLGYACIELQNPLFSLSKYTKLQCNNPCSEAPRFVSSTLDCYSQRCLSAIMLADTGVCKQMTLLTVRVLMGKLSLLLLALQLLKRRQQQPSQLQAATREILMGLMRRLSSGVCTPFPSMAVPEAAQLPSRDWKQSCRLALLTLGKDNHDSATMAAAHHTSLAPCIKQKHALA